MELVNVRVKRRSITIIVQIVEQLGSNFLRLIDDFVVADAVIGICYLRPTSKLSATANAHYRKTDFVRKLLLQSLLAYLFDLPEEPGNGGRELRIEKYLRIFVAQAPGECLAGCDVGRPTGFDALDGPDGKTARGLKRLLRPVGGGPYGRGSTRLGSTG
jgi:hypothetical protein